MLSFNKKIINLSPYKEIYSKLIFENCLHNLEFNGDYFSSISKDEEFLKVLYNLIIYGNVSSRTNKSISTHSQLLSLDDDNKYYLSLEIENFQRIMFYLDKILIFVLFLNFILLTTLFHNYSLH